MVIYNTIPKENNRLYFIIVASTVEIERIINTLNEIESYYMIPLFCLFKMEKVRGEHPVQTSITGLYENIKSKNQYITKERDIKEFVEKTLKNYKYKRNFQTGIVFSEK